MAFKAAAAVLMWVIALVVHAHPGHPALGPEHSHGLFGIDPLYGLVLIVLGVAAVMALRTMRLRARGQ